METPLFTCRVIFSTTLLILITSTINEANAKTKQMVEDAGCPFVRAKQLLVRNVCLLPDYQPNELPNNNVGKTNVQITLA